jgi:hypothetical protein
MTESCCIDWDDVHVILPEDSKRSERGENVVAVKLNSIDRIPTAPAVKHIDPNHNRIRADDKVVASVERVEVSVLHVVALGIFADKLPDRLCLVVGRNIHFVCFLLFTGIRTLSIFFRKSNKQVKKEWYQNG